MADDDPRLTATLELKRRDITTISEYTLESDYLASTDSFSFTAFHPEPETLYNLELEPVDLKINGASQLLGHIEKSRVGDKGTAWTFSGRDYLSRVVENHVDPTVSIKQDELLVDVVRRVAAPAGIEGCIGDDEAPLRHIRTGKSVTGAGAPTGFRAIKTPDMRPKPGTGMYAFLTRTAARLGVTVQPAGHRGVLSLSRPHYTQDPTFRLWRKADAPGNGNILSGVATRDFTAFPTFAMFTGKGGRPSKTKSNLSVDLSVNDLVATLGGELERILDGKLHHGRLKPGEVPPELAQLVLYRLLYQKDDESRTLDQLLKVATRAMSERLKDALMYEVTLPGHSDPDTGAVYAVDTVADVQDSVCNLHEPLWISSRRFGFSKSSGATTTLRCWRLGAFVIDA